MASYKKYAENLIGDWDKDIYEPQKDVTKAIYQTNWNKLTNDYNTVKDKLSRNFNLAQMDYSNTLNDIQNESFNRMQNANIDLANRGLSSSGILDLVSQGDTQIKGGASDKALANLLAANNASLEGLSDSVMGLGEGQTKLAGDLASDIGKLTEADAANNQQYAGLLANIAEGAASRAASRARSGGGGKSKEDKKLDEMYRTLGIMQTINDDSLSDDDKRFILANEYDVDINKTNRAIKGYNDNKKLDETNEKIKNLKNSLQNSISIAYNQSLPSSIRNLVVKPITKPIVNSKIKRVNNLQNDINGLTYSDLNEILFGNK